MSSNLPKLKADDPRLRQCVRDILLPGIYQLPGGRPDDATVDRIIDDSTESYRTSGGWDGAIKTFKRFKEGYAIKV